MPAFVAKFAGRFGFRTDQGRIDAKTWRQGTLFLIVPLAATDHHMVFFGALHPSRSRHHAIPGLGDIGRFRLSRMLRFRDPPSGDLLL